MAMTSWMMIMLALMGGDPGVHLLDYASTQAYWKSKGVAVSVESMLNELKTAGDKEVAALIADLASPDANVRAAAERGLRQMGLSALPHLDKIAAAADPQVSGAARNIAQGIRVAAKAAQVRQLMAIRTLGELGKADAINTLRPLLQSKEMFVAEYTERAIARLEKKAWTPKALTHQERLGDVWMLPAESRMILSASFPRDVAADRPSFDQLIDNLQFPQPPPGGVAPDRAQLKEQMTRAVIMVADKVGDIRIDHLAFGLSGDVGKDGGFASIIVRGEFDAKAVNAALAEVLPQRQAIGGFDVYTVEGFARIFTASNTHAAAIIANNAPPPIEQFTANLANRAGKLSQVKEVSDLVKKVEGEPVLWGVIHVTPQYRNMIPDLTAFDSMVLTGHGKPGGIDLALKAQGANPADVAAAAKRIDDGIKAGLAQIKPMANMMPAIKPVVEIMESMKVATDGGVATMTARVNGSPAVMLLPILFGTAVRAEAAPMPPPVQPQP